MAAGVRTPHQNRSWPSTRRTSAPQRRPRSARWRSPERVGLGGEQDEVGMAGRDLVELDGRVALRPHRRTRRRGRGGRGPTRRRCRPFIVIHGRRQIGTNARPRRPAGGTGGPEPRSEGSRCRRRDARPPAASASRHGSTSATASTWVTCSRSPAAVSASASARRFSSSFTTTRSGASATIAARSGSFVPPTAAARGARRSGSPRPGDTDQASSVSVTEGTRLTTRGDAAGSGHPAASASAPRTGPA